MNNRCPRKLDARHVTYLYDGESRPYAGVYASGEATPVAFGIATTDRGDVRELTDISGTPFAFYAYDAYGMPLAAESTATASVDAMLAATIAGANVLRYAGYCFDEHSGLYYLSQRYYDPATCQFITKDPAKADGEESAYQYCGGDPVGSVDPSGEWSLAYAKTFNLTTSLRTIADWIRRTRDAIAIAMLTRKLPNSTTWTIAGTLGSDWAVSRLSALKWRRELSRLGYHAYRRLFGQVWVTVSQKVHISASYIVSRGMMRIASTGGIVRAFRVTLQRYSLWQRRGVRYVRLV